MEISKPTVQFVTIDENHAGQRLDNFLRGHLGFNIPKSLIYRIIRKGEVRVNKGRAKPDMKLKWGDIVRVPPVRVPDKDATTVPVYHLDQLEKAVLYEDDDIIVINKPSGMAVHGGTEQSYGLIDIVQKMRPNAKMVSLVHRLDKGTSGCIILAKKRQALLDLQAQFQADEIEKYYLALTRGRWLANDMLVTEPLKKNHLQSGERVVVVSSDGKPAKTAFTVMNTFSSASLVEAKLFTGRTHQIRVHAACKHHPIAGDDKYGDATFNAELKKIGLNRLFLHAHRLGFKLPGTESRVTIKAPMDPALNAVLDQLEKNT